MRAYFSFKYGLHLLVASSKLPKLSFKLKAGLTSWSFTTTLRLINYSPLVICLHSWGAKMGRGAVLLGLVIGLTLYLTQTLGVALALALNLLALAWGLLLLRLYTELLEEKGLLREGKERGGGARRV